MAQKNYTTDGRSFFTGDDKPMKELGSKSKMAEPKEEPTDFHAKMVVIHPSEGKAVIHHADGQKTEHNGEPMELQSLEDLHDKLDKFFSEEEQEFKEEPEWEEEDHKGSLMGDDSPFSGLGK